MARYTDDNFTAVNLKFIMILCINLAQSQFILFGLNIFHGYTTLMKQL